LAPATPQPQSQSEEQILTSAGWEISILDRHRRAVSLPGNCADEPEKMFCARGKVVLNWVSDFIDPRNCPFK